MDECKPLLAMVRVHTRGLHSSFSQLNLSRITEANQPRGIYPTKYAHIKPKSGGVLAPASGRKFFPRTMNARTVTFCGSNADDPPPTSRCSARNWSRGTVQEGQ